MLVAGVSALQAPLLVPANSHWKAMPSVLTMGSLVIFQVRFGTAVMNTLITLSRAAARPSCGVPTVASK
ncbi:hypothetical protein D9M68_955690 [compost metagenome]